MSSLPVIHDISQIGINYFGQSGQLKGCINDANNLKAFLMSMCKS